MARGLTGGALALLLIPVSAMAADAPSPGPKERGQRQGQALAAAKICPGARTTAKVATLADGLDGAALKEFEAGRSEVTAGWDKAFSCTDVDPAQSREINGCRKAKILSCSVTWQEIGPEGTAFPGLLEFKPADPASDP